ncbi:GSCFA family protein [Muriicola jejuensis]|uniref:GSCFA domain-containing protein n=1 Tax=Muriicola jejuensis TaxID=504488 RepID=A0A6P0UIS0_9FLAO|nr:GSCFA domain-containing protein [Muriicola jejuensis]NER11719.1 GSCFA domain-containing protein [Muriicola jejuensis]SMP25133.1 GSCFA family protein [Muriicola jejuensis]
MELQTRLTLPHHPQPISYQGKVLLLGSCFAGHIGGKLSHYQFRNTLNPFGTLFQPRAIANLLDRALTRRYFREEDCFYHRERWHSHEVHSDLSNPAREELIKTLNRRIEETGELLSGISHLVITLGTAWGYIRKDNGQWVANCHKVPQKEFEKVLASPDEILKELRKALSDLFKINPGISVIFTVSPVRHSKDGFVENQRSKSHLFVALHQLLEEFEDRGVFYFPAYELLMDELRDYRFYEADMLHPNTLAVDYIWERFRESCIIPADEPVMTRVGEIRRGMQHRPFYPDSLEYKTFKADLAEKIKDLKKEYPFMTFGSGL